MPPRCQCNIKVSHAGRHKLRVTMTGCLIKGLATATAEEILSSWISESTCNKCGQWGGVMLDSRRLASVAEEQIIFQHSFQYGVTLQPIFSQKVCCLKTDPFLCHLWHLAARSLFESSLRNTVAPRAVWLSLLATSSGPRTKGNDKTSTKH